MAIHALVLDHLLLNDGTVYWIDSDRSATNQLVDAETSLLVTTGYDHFYRNHPRRSESGKDIMVRTLAMMAGTARDYDLPVLLTRRRMDEFSEPLANASSDVITYEDTEMGPRFTGEDFETLVYPRRDGFQTTLEYWRRILAVRHPGQHVAVASATGGFP